MGLTFDHHTHGQRVLFGTGAALGNTIAAVTELGARRVLLIADQFAVQIADEIATRIPRGRSHHCAIDPAVQPPPRRAGRPRVAPPRRVGGRTRRLEVLESL